MFRPAEEAEVSEKEPDVKPSEEQKGMGDYRCY